jgi:hypothetical protein
MSSINYNLASLGLPGLLPALGASTLGTAPTTSNAPGTPASSPDFILAGNLGGAMAVGGAAGNAANYSGGIIDPSTMDALLTAAINAQDLATLIDGPQAAGNSLLNAMAGVAVQNIVAGTTLEVLNTVLSPPTGTVTPTSSILA